MGHLGHLKAEYRDLANRLNAGSVGFPEPQEEASRRGWQEILEILYTPEEAALAARLPVLPSSIGAIAARVGIPQEELKHRLDRMADKGIVMDLIHPKTGKTRYLLSPPVVGFFEFSLMRAQDTIPKKRMAEALDAYTHGDPAFALEVFGGETVIGKTMVHESALSDEELPDVLDWERSTSVIEEAQKYAVSWCYCRHKAEHLGTRCDAPMDVCLSINAGAAFVLHREFGREIDRSEAMDILVQSRESGLVQIADNVQNKPTYICNCCGCCCGQLQAINEYDLPGVNPSGFVATCDLEDCTGCSRCARACPVGAIEMRPSQVTGRRKNDLKARVDPDRCIGCGVCVGACGSHKAMSMTRRKVQPKVPRTGMEKILRMAIERGKLADLLFDQGAGRGNRFLNRVVHGLTALGPIERVVASEQVTSRFIQFALRNVSDPTG